MKRKEITESNKIIARFMAGDQLNIMSDPERWLKSGFKYHSDWNYLIAVIQKIDSMGYDVQISRISCKISRILDNVHPIVSWGCGDLSKKLDICYTAIVQFIKWHNEKGGRL